MALETSVARESARSRWLLALSCAPLIALAAQLTLLAHVRIELGCFPVQSQAPEIPELGSAALSLHSTLTMGATLSVFPCLASLLLLGLPRIWNGRPTGLSLPAAVAAGGIALWFLLNVLWGNFSRFLGWWFD